MKILLLSDLHIEFGEFDIDTTGVDIVVLAGDIHTKKNGVKWALDNIKDIPVIYVLGNHEYYGEKYPSLIVKLKELCASSNVHVLENTMQTINGVNFFGCTLWTDFNLFGDIHLASLECLDVMNDFNRIRRLPDFRKFRPADAANAHFKSLNWLKSNLKEHKGETNIIVSHHAPSPISLPIAKHKDLISAAYASNLESVIIEYAPTYWFHGHIHTPVDYKLGNCQIVSNPRGYPDKEKTNFNPTLTIDITLN